MNGSPATRRLSVPLLWVTLALSACSSAPQPRATPPRTLDEVNLALAWRFADVTLTNQVVMRRLRGVSVTAAKLLWKSDDGVLRQMPIEEVARIVLRGKDPDAAPPTEGARLMDGPQPPGTRAAEPDSSFLSGSWEGETGALVGAAAGALALAAEAGDNEPAVLIYESPVTRYLLPAGARSATGSDAPP